MRSWFPFLLLFVCGPLHGCSKERPPNVAETDIQLKLPPVEAFTFGPGDAMRISVWRHEDLTLDAMVAPDGYISYPVVGRIEVAGKTYEEVIKTLQAAVSEYYVDAQVVVNITVVANQKVLVMGEVQTQQVIQITSDLSLLEALTRSGGINSSSNTHNVLIVRGGIETPTLFTVDVDAIYGKGDFSQMVYLQRGDIVFVPTRTITNIERYFRSLQAVLAPAVGGSAIYKNVISGAGGTQGAASSLNN